MITEVTEVKIKKINSNMRAKAIATVILNNEIKITDIKIFERENGPFVAMPSRKTENGIFKDIACPIRDDVRRMIERAILEEYSKE